jgi:ubiquinone/menaquinone biosynthesis C-methylase UbiE
MNRQSVEHNSSVFNRDVQANAGYLYTSERLSSQLVGRHTTDVLLSLVSFRGQRVLDIGCGDGAYTFELFDRAQPAHIHGVDVADEAVRLAREKAQERARERAQERALSFDVEDAHNLSFAANSHDVALMRNMLHHMHDPARALAEALRVAPRLVVIDPNGYNPVLKVIEKTSRYHIEHGERSYAPAQMQRWVEAAGGRVVARRWFNLVPYFCPDGLARLLKALEPVFEGVPLLNRAACGSFIFVAERS